MKLSIVVLVYNGETYLNRCLNSVFSQDLNDFEVICVNDGSTDNSIQILEEYRQKHSNMSVISQTNGGPSVTRNTGLKHSQGEYVFFLDNDDFFLDNMSISKALEFAKTEQLDICAFNAMINGENSYVNGIESIEKQIFKGEDYFEKSMILTRDLATPIWLNLYRRHFLLDNDLWFSPEKIHEDEYFTPIAVYRASTISFINICVNHYVFNRVGSITNNANEKYLIDRLNTARDLFKHFSDIKANSAAFSLVFSMYCNVFCQIPKGVKCAGLTYTASDRDNMRQCATTFYEKKCYKLYRFFPSLLEKYRANTLNPLLRKLINRFL